MTNPFEREPHQNDIVDAKHIATQAERFAKLKESLAKLPFPEHYKNIGIKTFGDESMAVLEIWQSDKAMEEGDPMGRIARITVDLVEGKIHTRIDSGYALSKHLFLSSFDFKHEGKSDAEILESINEDITGGKNPFEDTEVQMIRDPRVQAIVNYIINLEKTGLQLEYDENNFMDRKLALAVRQDQLELLEEEINSPKALEGNTEHVLAPTQSTELETQAEKIKTELEHLKRIDEEYERRVDERAKEAAKNPDVRNRRSRRAFDTDNT